MRIQVCVKARPNENPGARSEGPVMLECPGIRARSRAPEGTLVRRFERPGTLEHAGIRAHSDAQAHPRLLEE